MYNIYRHNKCSRNILYLWPIHYLTLRTYILQTFLQKFICSTSYRRLISNSNLKISNIHNQKHSQNMVNSFRIVFGK